VYVFLAALVCFGILTLWIPAYWPVAVFQVGVFALAAIVVWRSRNRLPGFSYPLVPLGFAVAWGLLQWLTGRTAYSFATQTATVQWATFLAVFLIGSCLFDDAHVCRWFRSAMLWFSFAVAVEATLQTFSSHGKVFWLFPSGYSDYIMGPILYRNHYAAFIEAVLPIALYQALQNEHDSLLYSGMAAAMYASVIASASRAGTVLTSCEILAVILLMGARGRTSGRAIGLALLRIAILFVVFASVAGWGRVWDRFWTPDPMAVRRELAMSSLQMIADHPWSGVGLGAWPTVYPRYATMDTGAFANQSHNDWLQWTAEGGIPFGLLMVGLFLWSLRPAFRTVWGLGVVAVFLHALVDYPFSRPALGSWFILVLAMLASAHFLQEVRKPSGTTY
jgi:O-antigen ligase